MNLDELMARINAVHGSDFALGGRQMVAFVCAGSIMGVVIC